MESAFHLTNANPDMVDEFFADLTPGNALIEEAVLAMNELTILPKSIYRLESVRRLYLGGNCFPEFPIELLSLVTLEHIDLGFAIRALQPETPQGGDVLTSLKSLSLVGCGPVPQWVVDFPALESIALDYGQVLDLRDRVNLPKGLQVIPVNPKKIELEIFLDPHDRAANFREKEINKIQNRLDRIDQEIQNFEGKDDLCRNYNGSLNLGFCVLMDTALPLNLRKIILEDDAILQELIDNPL